MRLPLNQVREHRDNGYLVVREMFTEALCDQMIDHYRAMHAVLFDPDKGKHMRALAPKPLGPTCLSTHHASSCQLATPQWPAFASPS